MAAPCPYIPARLLPTSTFAEEPGPSLSSEPKQQTPTPTFVETPRKIDAVGYADAQQPTKETEASRPFQVGTLVAKQKPLLDYEPGALPLASITISAFTGILARPGARLGRLVLARTKLVPVPPPPWSGSYPERGPDTTPIAPDAQPLIPVSSLAFIGVLARPGACLGRIVLSRTPKSSSAAVAPSDQQTPTPSSFPARKRECT